MALSYADIVSDLERVAKSLGKEPLVLTRTEYFKHGECPEWEFRKRGGFRAVIEDAFGPVDKDVLVTRAQARRRNELSRLQMVAGDKQYVALKVTERLEQLLTLQPIKIPRFTATKPKKTQPRENVVFISDTHFGLDIDQAEVITNSYSWQIAARRMAKLAEQCGSYKKEHRASCEAIRVCLGGDIIAGIIHDDDHGLELLSAQIHGALSILVQFVAYLKKHYSKVYIEGTSGNHDRMPHRHPKRALVQRHDSYATVIYQALETAFRKERDIVFHLPKTPYTEFNIFNHRFILTHGDNFPRIGSPAHSVPIGKITNAIRVLQSNMPNKPIAAVLAGHVHTSLLTTLDSGTRLVINGCASGTDAFAQSLGYIQSNPSQTIFEVTPEHAVGDYRSIDLNDAGANESYDAIITV